MNILSYYFSHFKVQHKLSLSVINLQDEITFNVMTEFAQWQMIPSRAPNFPSKLPLAPQGFSEV